ncbi:MAG: hypothetical protein R2766_01075 [Saprospiraceae bacterium]
MPARKYRPSLDQLDDQCSFSANNPLIKINLVDEPDPFIEYMLFFGYNGISTADSKFKVDDNGRPHFLTRKEGFFTDTEITVPSNADFNSDLYFIFENDLSDVEVRLNSTGSSSTTEVLPLGLKVYDNKAYLFGSIADNLTSLTPNWTDNDGNTNTIIQSNFGNGQYDGLLSVIDNHEICEGCDTTTVMVDTCDNIVMHLTVLTIEL